mgnify:FL=1|jgi:hypothetical protein|nr:MAG TPA: INTEGRATION HOST FACTOR/DNA COMPLEX (TRANSCRIPTION REGULATION-DNA), TRANSCRIPTION FACTOR [Caudoviricetes sp.]
MEINAIKELQGALEERGLKLSQAETKEVLKALEDTIDSIYDQMEVDDSVSLGLFLIDKKIQKGRKGIMKTKPGEEKPFETEDKVTVKVRLKKSVKKRIEE